MSYGGPRRDTNLMTAFGVNRNGIEPEQRNQYIAITLRDFLRLALLLLRLLHQPMAIPNNGFQLSR